MDIEKMQEEFECWVRERSVDTPAGFYPQLTYRCALDNNRYMISWVDSAWEGWKASRESLVIDLHKEFKDDTGKPFGELLTLIANAILEDCRKDILAAGVKTK